MLGFVEWGEKMAPAEVAAVLMDSAEQNLQVASFQLEKLADMLAEAAHCVHQHWRLLCNEVIDGKTEQVQSKRDEFLSGVHFLRDLLIRLHRAGRRLGMRDIDRLLADTTAIEEFCSRLERRWQDAESLEYLVAEDVGPTSEQWETISRKYAHTFPQTDEEKPF